MHITKLLYDKGYETYRYVFSFPGQNASAKEQVKHLMKRKDLIFREGSRTTDICAFYYPFGSILKINDFSTMVVGGLDIRFVKDGDFENPIVWGLNEYNSPPTIVYPRPRIIVKRVRKQSSTYRRVSMKGVEIIKRIDPKNYISIENELRDDSMNLVLEKEDSELIFEALYDSSIIFKYDLT